MFIDNVFKKPTIESEDQVSYGKSFMVGLWQTIAMIPGVSRSAASIIGGMSQKFTRFVAAEFSFFLAVPTMFAASAYSLFLKKWELKDESGNMMKDIYNKPIIRKGYQIIMDSSENTISFITGNVVAFVVALLAIRFFINYLKVYGFKIFGIYRILAGITLLILLLTKVIDA
jgi:undecaprenyl-diphosphatase